LFASKPNADHRTLSLRTVGVLGRKFLIQLRSKGAYSENKLFGAARVLRPNLLRHSLRSPREMLVQTLSQLTWAHLKAVGAVRPRRLRAPQVKLLDLGSPFASKANVVAYDRHVLFTSDNPADATRHRAPCPISTTRIDEAFIYEMPEELVGLVFAQANALAYACDLGVGVYLVPSALALLDSPEHGFALVVVSRVTRLHTVLLRSSRCQP
jgi:hypothetical protein